MFVGLPLLLLAVGVAIPIVALRGCSLPGFLDPTSQFFDVYQAERVVPAVEDLNGRVGEGAMLVKAEVYPSGITFTVIEAGEARTYNYDTGGDFESVRSAGTIDPRGAFAIDQLDGEAPERIFEAMKEASGVGGLIYSFGYLQRDPFGSDRVHWTVAAGNIKAEAVSYTATPAGELIGVATDTSAVPAPQQGDASSAGQK